MLRDFHNDFRLRQTAPTMLGAERTANVHGFTTEKEGKERKSFKKVCCLFFKKAYTKVKNENDNRNSTANLALVRGLNKCFRGRGENNER